MVTPKVKKVETLLLQRTTMFENQTRVIFDRIITTLDGIRDYLISVDPSYLPGLFYWNDVYMEDDLMMVRGVVKYEPGATFILDNDIIEVTKDNKEYFNRVLQMAVPFSVVNKYESEAVVEFYTQLQLAADQDREEALRRREDMRDVLDKPEPFSFDNDIKLNPDITYEFNLDDLSDDQRKALLLHTDTEKLN